jgi:hypothetical protein
MSPVVRPLDFDLGKRRVLVAGFVDSGADEGFTPARLKRLSIRCGHLPMTRRFWS